MHISDAPAFDQFTLVDDSQMDEWGSKNDATLSRQWNSNRHVDNLHELKERIDNFCIDWIFVVAFQGDWRPATRVRSIVCIVTYS